MIQKVWKVRWSKSVRKQLRQTPIFIKEKLRAWTRFVEADGMPRTRMIKGFHDEPLTGKRWGQRSVRLNGAWRAIYVESSTGDVQIVTIIEVNKHDY